jgi:hypothetical protein
MAVYVGDSDAAFVLAHQEVSAELAGVRLPVLLDYK